MGVSGGSGRYTFGSFGHRMVSISLLLYSRPCGNAVSLGLSKEDGKKLQMIDSPYSDLLNKANICVHQVSTAPAVLSADPFTCIVSFQYILYFQLILRVWGFLTLPTYIVG